MAQLSEHSVDTSGFNVVLVQHFIINSKHLLCVRKAVCWNWGRIKIHGSWEKKGALHSGVWSLPQAESQEFIPAQLTEFSNKVAQKEDSMWRYFK